MRKLFCIIFTTALISTIPGCGFTASNKLYDHTVKYKIINENDISHDMASQINSIKNSRGYSVFKNDGNYILISSGRKNTGGYEINIKSSNINSGTLKIVVEEISPTPDAIVTQAITYPHIILKVDEPFRTLKVINTNGAEFKPIKITKI